MSLSDPMLAIDLSRVPAPQVLPDIDFDALVTALIAELQARWPEYDTPLESDPAVKLLEVHAWREVLLRQAIVDAVKSVLLPFATGAMLDQLGSRFNLPRLVLQQATATTPAILESDDDFRARIQIAPETLPYAGITAAGYRARALAIAPDVKDVAALRRGQGRIDLVLLARAGDGTVAGETVSAVAAEFDREDVVQLTDVLTVRAAKIVPYAVAVTLQLGRGPDASIVRAEAEAAIRAHALSRHRIGRPVYRRGIEAAAKIGGVEQAIADMDDVLPGDDGAAWLSTLTVESELAA